MYVGGSGGREPSGDDPEPDRVGLGVLGSGEHELGDPVQRPPRAADRNGFLHPDLL
jgi:hypothetical protein